MGHFKILEFNSYNREFIENPIFNRDYTLIGNFYEHIKNTTGFVYDEEGLESYIKTHKQDPTKKVQDELLPVPGEILLNFSNEWEIIRMMVFSLPHKKEVPPLIRQNYKRYELYLNKSIFQDKKYKEELEKILQKKIHLQPQQPPLQVKDYAEFL